MLLIGTDAGIYRWTEGNNWPIFHGLQDRSVVGISTAGAGRVAAVDAGGSLWESLDNGLSWRGLPVPDGSGTPWSLAVDENSGNLAMATHPLRLYRRPFGAALHPHRSFLTVVTDRANAWKEIAVRRVRPTAQGQGATALAERPAAKNSPRSFGWTKLANPPLADPKAAGNARLLHLGRDNWFAGLVGGGLFRSADLGETWTSSNALKAEVFVIREIPGVKGSLVAATADGLHFSLDGGATWEDRGKGLESVRVVRAVDVRPDNPKILLAAANSQVDAATQGDALYESGDGGKSWTKVVRSFPEKPPIDQIVDIRHDPSHPDNTAVAFASGELWMTRNAGIYWQPFARQIREARALCPVV